MRGLLALWPHRAPNAPHGTQTHQKQGLLAQACHTPGSPARPQACYACSRTCTRGPSSAWGWARLAGAASRPPFRGCAGGQRSAAAQEHSAAAQEHSAAAQEYSSNAPDAPAPPRFAPAARGYLNLSTLYIVWLCAAVFYHLPSLEQLGLDVRADLSLLIVAFIATLAVRRPTSSPRTRASPARAGSPHAVPPARGALPRHTRLSKQRQRGRPAHTVCLAHTPRAMSGAAPHRAAAQVFAVLVGLHAAAAYLGLLPRRSLLQGHGPRPAEGAAARPGKRRPGGGPADVAPGAAPLGHGLPAGVSAHGREAAGGTAAAGASMRGGWSLDGLPSLLLLNALLIAVAVRSARAAWLAQLHACQTRPHASHIASCSRGRPRVPTPAPLPLPTRAAPSTPSAATALWPWAPARRRSRRRCAGAGCGPSPRRSTPDSAPGCSTVRFHDAGRPPMCSPASSMLLAGACLCP